ncbi:hypothetical protein [Pontibacter chinhatensis]|uniref:Fimbrillin family protein n=1 Tax=Pontibacter chinhatensis TaxID=1436961 RepID=A0A1I2MFS9_9BACT|nr:hypothetical protein [Pontibacter chinhatensis]SFF88387.1 hypothetical protein SAMN05421739_101237 [Pontibacter chinhatensis]
MKKYFRSSVLISAMFASAFLLGGCEKDMEQDGFATSAIQDAKAGNSKSAQTAQSVMINIDAPDVIVVEGGEWRYNAAVAKTYFTGSNNGHITSSVNSSENKCAFFYGGTLTGKNSAVPVGNGMVEAGTAWDFVPSSTEGSGPREVSINFDLASQAVVINSNKGTKYNFAISADRVVDLTVKVVNEATSEEIVFPIAAEDYAIATGEENPYLYMLPYITNAGKAGNTLDILQEGMTMSQVLQLNTPGFGSKNPEAEAAVLRLIEPLKLNLENGSYRVTVSGIVRGIEAATDANFAVDRTFEITGAPNCK